MVPEFDWLHLFKWGMRFFHDFVLFSFPPPPSRFIPRLICPLEVMSSSCCPQHAQGSLSNADEQWVCVGKCLCMCIITWALPYADLHDSIIKIKKIKTRWMLWSRWQQENVSGNDFESPSLRNPTRDIYLADRRSVTQTNGWGSPTRPFGEWRNHSESVNGVWLLFSLQSANLSLD